MDKINFIIVLFLTFMISVYMTVNNNNSAIEMRAKDISDSAAVDFCEDVADNGFIDLTMYNNLVNDLARSKIQFKIEIIHNRVIAYPGKPSEFRMISDSRTSLTILDCITKGNKYKLNKGDYIKINLVSNRNKGGFLAKSSKAIAEADCTRRVRNSD